VRNSYDVLTKNIPAWYELGFSEKGLIIRAHKTAAAFVKQTLTASSPIIRALGENLQLPQFIEPKERTWGFGETIVRHNQSETDWITWICKLPAALDGGVNWAGAYAVSATLNALFLALSLAEDESDCPKPQLLLVDNMSTRRKMYGGALSVIISPALCLWLSRQEDGSQQPDIVSAMKTAFQQMRGEVSEFDRFSAWCRQPKWINLSCPGDACGLDPENYYDNSLEKGYCLFPHNTDSPVQQLTFLAGIAALYELARQGGV
jgi:hypothetical protein